MSKRLHFSLDCVGLSDPLALINDPYINFVENTLIADPKGFVRPLDLETEFDAHLVSSGFTVISSPLQRRSWNTFNDSITKILRCSSRARTNIRR
jgi:hypothetical protein